MGNTHICYHRLPAFSTAVLASIAYSFVLVAGTTCDFINVHANPGSFLEYVTEDGITVDMYETKLGLLCETPPFFVRGTDQLWSMSLYFWIASSVVGALCVSLSWALTLFLGPTDLNWKILSFLAGVSAILQSPMYVIFASDPCKENNCTMSTGCVMLSISTIFWVTLTFLTQCQDPPMWANELNAWRVQKERQEGVARPRLESKWSRWIRRRRWATGLGLAATDSESINDVSRMELLENGSYYADSNNSRLMLKVMPDGKRPDDDNKSVGTFGDLEDMVMYADEQRTFAQLEPLPTDSLEKENDPHEIPNDGMPLQQPRELLTIHSHTDTPQSVLNKREERAFLLGDDDESPNLSCMEPPRQIIITGIRSLAERMRRDTMRNKSRYSHLDDDDADSDADIEDEIDGPPEDFSTPMSPQELSQLCQEESPTPPHAQDSRSQVLLNDWNALHAAANAGILLPTTISLADTEEDAEPKFYSADDSASEVSLASYGDFPDDEEAEGGVSASSVSSDSSNDESPRKHRRHRRRVRRAFSATNSVGSRTSLLDLTIEEETAGDLQEMGSSGDEKKAKKSLSQDYALRGVKSAPDRLGFASATNKVSGVNISDSSDLLLLELDCVSEDSDSHISDILGKAGEVTGDSQAGNSEESTELSSSITSAKDMTNDLPQVTLPQRGRGMSVPRRKRSSVHPLSPTPRGKSAAARFRAERVEKAGIHSPHINVVSDDSSASEDSHADRSFRSTVSRRARKARVRRMHEDTVRRRARTVGPSNKRRAPPKPEVIIFDPTLRAILVGRDPGTEYGPDEASL